MSVKRKNDSEVSEPAVSNKKPKEEDQRPSAHDLYLIQEKARVCGDAVQSYMDTKVGSDFKWLCAGCPLQTTCVKTGKWAQDYKQYCSDCQAKLDQKRNDHQQKQNERDELRVHRAGKHIMVTLIDDGQPNRLYWVPVDLLPKDIDFSTPAGRKAVTLVTKQLKPLDGPNVALYDENTTLVAVTLDTTITPIYYDVLPNSPKSL